MTSSDGKPRGSALWWHSGHESGNPYASLAEDEEEGYDSGSWAVGRRIRVVELPPFNDEKG